VADSFGGLPYSRPLALATSILSRVRSESRSASNSAKVASTLKNMRPIGVVRVVSGGAELQTHVALLEPVGDCAGVGDRPGEPVELGHDERVALADSGQCLRESGPAPIAAGQPAVEVDALVRDAEAAQHLALSGEVLAGGRAAGIADQFPARRVSVRVASKPSGLPSLPAIVPAASDGAVSRG
jgi:hypothetical protein